MTPPLPDRIAAALRGYSQTVEDHVLKCDVVSARDMLRAVGALESAIAEVVAERDVARTALARVVANLRDVHQRIAQGIAEHGSEGCAIFATLLSLHDLGPDGVTVAVAALAQASGTGSPHSAASEARSEERSADANHRTDRDPEGDQLEQQRRAPGGADQGAQTGLREHDGAAGCGDALPAHQREAVREQGAGGAVPAGAEPADGGGLLAAEDLTPGSIQYLEDSTLEEAKDAWMRYRQAGRDAEALEGITTIQPDDPPVIVRREAESDLCRLLGDVCDGEANINGARYEELLRARGGAEASGPVGEKHTHEHLRLAGVANHDEGRICGLCGGDVPSGFRHEHGPGVCGGRSCAECGEWFTAKRSDAVTCSARCRQWRARSRRAPDGGSA